jgi:hypothetical protein
MEVKREREKERERDRERERKREREEEKQISEKTENGSNRYSKCRLKGSLRDKSNQIKITK